MQTLSMLREAGIKGGHAFKHRWTEDERDIIRRDYQGTNTSAALLAVKLSEITGERITKWAIKGQASKLGIMVQKSPDWKPGEIERLRELIHTHSVAAIARMLHRSPNAVKIKATRLKCCLGIRDGWYTKQEVCEILGVDHHWVQKQIDKGNLKAAWHTDRKPQKYGMAMWHIMEKDLQRFLLGHAGELVGRNVDLFQIVSILVPKYTHKEQ